MPPLRISVLSEPNEWREVNVINPGDPYGSVSHNAEDGSRDVYYFGIDAIEGIAVVKKSEMGLDIANASQRIIHDLGAVTTLAALQPGEEYQIKVRPDGSNLYRTVKFTYDRS